LGKPQFSRSPRRWSRILVGRQIKTPGPAAARRRSALRNRFTLAASDTNFDLIQLDEASTGSLKKTRIWHGSSSSVFSGLDVHETTDHGYLGIDRKARMGNGQTLLHRELTR
jgi:hypothetical protein